MTCRDKIYTLYYTLRKYMHLKTIFYTYIKQKTVKMRDREKKWVFITIYKI